MAIDKTKYTEESIKSLSPLEFTRLRPATYLGSNEYSTQLVREIFSNSLDEHIIGHGDIINIVLNYDKNEYSVEDNGQGFPINIEKDGETILQAAFDRFNTSGKYDDDGVYSGASLGLNGIGSKLINEFKNYCKNIGIENIKVTAYSENKQAINFYMKNGFQDYNTTLIFKI